jgi:diguanylate cyclase (GGDEF)-like protein/hemerythrin-like metal-binding protein
MHRVFNLFRTFKARVTLLTLLIVLLNLLALGAYAKWLLGEALLDFVGEQQTSALSLLSGQLTQAVQERQSALRALGRALPARSLQSKAALHNYLQAQYDLPSLFNAAVQVWNPAGQLQAELQFAHRQNQGLTPPVSVVQAVLRDATPRISISRRSATQAADLLTMVVPVRNAQGLVTGAVAGVIRLDQRNFLTPLTAQTYGKTGQFFVIDPSQRLIFASSDATRRMEVLPAPGVNSWIDRFMQGFQGTTRVVNPHGVEVLVTVQQIAQTGWYASVTLSPEEALGLVQLVAPQARVAALLLSLLCVTLIWLMLRHELRPMTEAVKTMEGFANHQLPPQSLQVVRPDEIGQLVGGFNRLLGTLTQQQQVLRQSELFQQAVLNSVTAEIAVLDHTGSIMAVNEAWRRSDLPLGPGLHQSDDPAVVGSNYLTLCDARLGQTPGSVGIPLSEGIRGVLSGALPKFHQEYPCHTAQARWAGVSVTPLNGELLQGAVVSIEDISERVQMQNQVHELAFYDPLTQLPNRRLVLDRLAHQMLRARRAQTRLALLFVDLDKFKPINDALGHSVGDWLLQNVAQRIQACLRESDTPARIGGDEFLVVLPDLQSQQAALAVAEKIRHELAQRFVTPQGNALHISSSIGVALFPDHALTEKDLLRLGDEAMYQAKKSGRNAVALCTAKAAPTPKASLFAAVDAEPASPPQSFVHVQWQPSFACGHAELDAEHHSLVGLINELLDRSVSRLAQPLAFEAAFKQLMAHVQVHFAHEEELLKSCGYAQLDLHAAQHQSLMARATLLHLALQDSATDKAAEVALIQFLVSDLVTSHILHADQAYFPALQSTQT